MQNRVGASIFQPYRDLIKLFHKDEVITEDASWLFTWSPYIIFATTLALAAGVPLISYLTTYMPTSDILVFVYLLAAGTFFLALSAMDTGGAFGGFGASREMMVAGLTEGGLLFSLVAIALMVGSSNITTMTVLLSNVGSIRLLPLILAAVAFFIALLAENARYPVDNPATHLELTMVHEAMMLEHSGRGLALMEWSAMNKLLIFIAVFVNIFAPFGLASSFAPADLAFATAVFLAKAVIVAATIAFIESTMAKFRIFRVPDFLFSSFVLSVIAILTVVL
jgi:formate hydrogenlyase subunit 4